MNNEKLEAGLASDLNRELDVVNNNMMCYWLDNTEIGHYLQSHINDDGNLTKEQSFACSEASWIILELRREVFKLRNQVFELENDCKVCGCELDKDYFDAAKARFDMATKQLAMSI